jgi:uracil permease
MAKTTAAVKKDFGYLPADTPPIGAMLSLGFQQVLTMFPATVLVAILTKFDVGVTLLASGIGTIIALFVSGRRIPMYYGSSFSYIAVVITTMSLYAGDCFSDPTTFYCPAGVRIVQVGIMGTGLVNILIGLLIMRIGKAALDKVLPPDHHRQCCHCHWYRPGWRCAWHGFRKLGCGFHHADLHNCLLCVSPG